MNFRRALLVAVTIWMGSWLPAAETVEKLNVDGLGRLPAFSHATVTGDLIFVSGTLGTKEGSFELVEGGVGPQTEQTIRNIEKILAGAGATLRDIAKVNVYLTDMSRFAEMNEAYLKFFAGDPPARTTAGVAALALGALVEIECVARRREKQMGEVELRKTSGFVKSGGEEIYYESVGQGDAIVLCHGLGGNHAIWYQQVAEFARSHRVITWDQRGFGRSTNRAGEASPAKAVEDLKALLDELKIDRAHLIGQSMGGWAVMGFALEHPERVASLILADTIGGIYNKAIEDSFDAMMRKRVAAQAAPFGRHPALGSDFVHRDPAKAILYEQIGSLGPPAPAEMARRLRETKNDVARLAAIKFPVLFIVGAEDPIFPPATIREAAGLVPGSRVVEIPGCGHSPYFEKPELWNAAALDFISKPR